MNIQSKYPTKKTNKEETSTYIPLWVVLLTCIAMIIAIWYRFSLSQDTGDIPELIGEPIVVNAQTDHSEEIIEKTEEAPPTQDPFMTDRDLMAAVVMSEAGSEKFIGKVAVAAVILNRADMFDSSIYGIVTAKNQFSYPYYGKITKACYEAVDYALENRSLFPKNMIYFRNQHFHDYGEEYIQIGNHYFSTAGEPEYELESLGEKD